jgi:hypothetical protein
MATRRSAQRASVTKANAFSACLSPPLWKDQLRERCLARLKQNRHELLAKLRSPDANIADEMKRLVFKEEQRGTASDGRRKGRGGRSGGSGARHLVFEEPQRHDGHDDGGLVTIDDLLVSGQLSEQDYLDIVHSLEDELRNEWDAEDEDERFAQEMMEFEEASLAAMLAGMGLDGPSDMQDDHEEKAPAVLSGGNYSMADDMADGVDGLYVLCPVCKASSLRETTDDASHAIVSCACGFSLRVKVIFLSCLYDGKQVY